MSRTSISVLQEYLQKQSQNLPKYTLVDRDGPHHETTFTIRVTFDSYFADGTAKTKRAAKHNAASSMIKLLNKQSHYNIDYNEPSIDVLPTESIPREGNMMSNDDSELPQIEKNSSETPINSIGKLQEICATRKMSSPIYEECGSGPEGGFTFQCRLGEFVKKATASSKKQAKQKSAELMRQYLIEKKLAFDEIVDKSQYKEDGLDIPTLAIEKLQIDDNDSFKLIIDKAKMRFPSLKKNVGITVEERNDLSVANFHNQLRNSFDSANIKRFLFYYKSLNFDKLQSNVAHSEHILKDIEDILNIRTVQKNMKTNGHDKYIVSIEFESKPAPVFREVGKGNSHDEAYLAALVRTITGIHLLLQ